MDAHLVAFEGKTRAIRDCQEDAPAVKRGAPSEAFPCRCSQYPRRDSNARTRLRRPLLYPPELRGHMHTDSSTWSPALQPRSSSGFAHASEQGSIERQLHADLVAHRDASEPLLRAPMVLRDPVLNHLLDNETRPLIEAERRDIIV